MSRKYVAVLVIASLLSLNTLTPAQALWPFGTAEVGSKDLRFQTIYPVSFWSSTTGIVLKYTGIFVGVAVVTYLSAGAVTWAAGGLFAQIFGAAVGPILGLSGAAAVKAGFAFLAFLGGGTVAAGGFGALGGLSVLVAISSLPLTAAIVNAASDQIPSGTHSKAITLIKPRLFWDKVSPAVKDDMKELRNILDDIAKTGGNEAQAKRVAELLRIIDTKLNNEIYSKEDEYTAYNSLLLAIIRYNLSKPPHASRRGLSVKFGTRPNVWTRLLPLQNTLIRRDVLTRLYPVEFLLIRLLFAICQLLRRLLDNFNAYNAKVT